MPSDFATLLSAGNLLVTLAERREREELEEKMNDGDGDDVERQALPMEMQQRDRIAEEQSEATEYLERLAEIEETNQPGPNDKDAFSSSVIELQDGKTAEVEVEPAEGFNLRVKRVYFDRKDDHTYDISVAGSGSQVAHRVVYSRPKLVSQSDNVIARVTNESGSPSVIDFELEAWAERPGGR